MKILVIHNFHRKGSASGDDVVFRNETVLLEENGNEVVRYSTQNDEFDKAGIIGKIVASLGMMWSFKHYKAVKKLIKEENPDLVHIHTFFPLLSPSVLYAAKRSGKKVVATLHDTRFVCPCATSLRGGELCNMCGDGRYLRMFRYGCFKGSKIQSLIVATIFKYHRFRRTFYNQIDKYIILNENQRKLLANIGFDENKIIKKYNFIPKEEIESPETRVDGMPDKYVVFYGRIGEEKGIRILMKIWEEIDDIPLVIMGSGPLEQELLDWATTKENVNFLGYTERSKCLSIVKYSEFVIFPSIWYEGCSMVEIETESLGKALIATDLGFSQEAITDGVNGYKVKSGDITGFRKRIRELWNDHNLCEIMGKNALNEYESKYLPDENYKQLISIYNKTLA